MKRQGAGTAPRTVIIARQRNRGGKVERLPEPLQRAHGHKMPEFRAPSCQYCNATPENTSAKNDILAPKAISDKPRNRSAESIDPHECRSNYSQAHFVKTKLFAQFRKHRINAL